MKWKLSLAALFLIGLIVGVVTVDAGSPGNGLDSKVQKTAPSLDGCAVFPVDNIWNARVDQLPLDPKSATYINSISLDGNDYLHPDFGSGVWPPGSNSPIGIPYTTVPGTQAPVGINYIWYGDESDPGPFPIPPNAPIEGGPDSTGDRHVLVMEHDNCMLYELYYAAPDGAGGWNAGSGAAYDLKANGPLRTDGWTSADAAGLPILPGLIRYDEVTAGAINHAIRFTAPYTSDTHVWPARHDAGSANNSYPPMGARLRLNAGYDISGFSPAVQVILQALKTYGLILADNGSGWFLSGAPDEGWDNDVLHELTNVPGSAFEVVDASVLMIDPNSGQARSWPPEPLFSDYFEDNDVSDWTPTKGAWSASSEMMTGSSIKKADNYPNLFTTGCTTCTVEADMIVNTPGAKVSLLGWFKDKKHTVEVQLNDGMNKVMVKLSGGPTAVKKTTSLTITPGVNYHVRVRYSAGKIVAEVTGMTPVVLNANTTPAGTVGFRVQSTTGVTATASFAGIVVY